MSAIGSDIETQAGNPVRIVQAAWDDASAVHTLLTACGRHMSKTRGFSNWDPPAPLARLQADAGKGNLHAVYMGLALVATFTISGQPSIPYEAVEWGSPDAPALYLNRLAVLPELQGKGLGLRCMEYVEESARQRGCVAVRFDVLKQNNSLRRFYERLGYKPCGERMHSGWEFVCYENGV